MELILFLLLVVVLVVILALRISVDAPGVAAVSAPVGDPMEFIRVFASQADLEYDDAQLPDSIVISVPPGS
jgi:hypothetical protein